MNDFILNNWLAVLVSITLVIYLFTFNQDKENINKIIEVFKKILKKKSLDKKNKKDKED